jgi:subtilase family serine protease
MARRALASALAVVVGVLLPLSAPAAQKPQPGDRVLPNIDVRLQTRRVTPAPDAAAQALLEELRGNRPGLRIRPHGIGAGLRALHADGKPLTAPERGTPEQIARRFLARYHHLLGLEGKDIALLAKSREYRSHNERVVHMVFDESVAGLSVFGARLQLTISGAGEILGIANSTISIGELPEATIAADDAVSAAISDIRPELLFGADVITGPTGPDRHSRFSRGPFKSDIEANLVVFPMATGARLAWHVVLEPDGLPQKYDVLIDAVTRELLYRRNRVLYADGSGRVLQSDSTAAANPRLLDPFPVGPGAAPGCPPVGNHTVRSLTAPFRDAATVLADTGRLEGNNTHVYRGAPGTEGATGTQQNGWQFDFTFNTADAAETHLFFLTNFLHDFFYDLGFDEAAGNFQESNFGRGGLGQDALVAVARASGRNNATFEPNPDGQDSIMSMFLWDGSGCWSQDVDGDGAADLDGDLDTDVAIHEFHHGVSNRLNTQWTGIEADAMGEGGSDFFAYSINNNTILAEYAAPPNGIRSVNGKTYGDFFCLDFLGLLFCEPHDNGEIFANVLWDLRERFRADNVGGTNAAAISMSHQLYVDALKLSPPSPTMLDLRDSILQADGIRNPSADPGGSKNHCRIWEVFATRGMGAAAQDTNDTGSASVVEDFTVGPECPALPPPTPVTITATVATAYEAGVQPGRWRFSRSGDVSRALTVYFTIGGTAAAGTDYVALPTSVQLAAGAATTDLALTPIDDTTVESNETVVLTLTGSVGYQVGTPSAATLTIVSDDVAPDLVVSALTVPSAGGAGNTLTVSATTKNQGSGAAGASVTRFYWSSNTTLDGGDTPLGASDIGNLAVGATTSSSIDLLVPAGTQTGTYYVLAGADANSAVTESSETNNTRSAMVRVGPDLNVSALGAPTVAAAGATVTVTDTTKNSGGGAVPASTTRFYVSSNTTVDTTDTLIGSRSVPQLGAGETSAASTNVVLPSSLSTGSFFIVAKSDGPDAIVETIETNNTRAVSVRIGPDLDITALTSTGAWGAGSTVTINDTTKNQGGGASDTSITRLYLSSNTTVDAGDVVLGARTVPPLDGGVSSAVATSVQVPAGTATGGYYVLAQADAGGTNAETSETNNVGSLFVRIGPDLTIGSITGPTAVGAGATITINETTRNAGGGSAGGSTTRYYLSNNTAVEAGDWLLGSRAVPGLSAAGASSQSMTVTLPSGVATGKYYLLAVADADNVVGETIETNNSGYLTVQLGPDLVESALTGPASVAAGSSFTVTDTAKNQGGGTAAPSTTRFYLSTTTTFDASDKVLGGRSVLALGPTATHAGSATLLMPAGTVAGKYYILAIADGDGALPETSETNNVRAVAITVN